VFPREQFWEHLLPMPISELPEAFPELRDQARRIRHQRDRTQPELRDLVRMIRNSFAHFSLETEAHQGRISRLVLSNRNPAGHVTWQMRISVLELREFVEWFARGVIDSSLLDCPIEEIKVA
jgi:hypothetical protein